MYEDGTVLRKGKPVFRDGVARPSIRIQGCKVGLHRVIAAAFLPLPNDPHVYMVDHINGNIYDNRVQNLRWASPTMNGENRKEHRNGATLGVYYHKRERKWRAQARKLPGHPQIQLGSYATREEAVAALRNFKHFSKSV